MSFAKPGGILALVAVAAFGGAPNAREDTRMTGPAWAPSVPDALDAIPVYLAVDAGTGQVLAARQPMLSFVPASLTKVMTAYLAFELIAAGKLDPQTRYALSPASHARWAGKGTRLDLRPGEAVAVDTLLAGITTVSANDACVALAEGYAGSLAEWTRMMNAEAGRLGMADSHFGTPNGWPDNGATFVSARDLVTLGRAMVNRHPQLYKRYFGRKALSYGGVTRLNHDPTTGVVTGADGIKTGFTREAGYGFLGSAERQGRRVMIVVAGAHSEAERASASRALMEWSYTAWETRPLFKRGEEIVAVKVQNAASREVVLVAPADLAITLPRSKAKSASWPRVSLRVRYVGPAPAPIEKGARLATMDILIDGAVVAQTPLLAAKAISVAGPFDRLANGLAGLFS